MAAAATAALLGVSQPALAQFIQQGSKLVGNGAAATAGQGSSVAFSADGNTAIVGAPSGDFSNIGAAWVFTRNGGVWSQQGAKLVVGSSQLSFFNTNLTPVALSADGNTALVGSPGADETWVFTRTGGVWSEQAVLVGTGELATTAYQGSSVALSADGNTAIVGGPFDGGNRVDIGIPGAVWIFTRSNGIWSQQAKLAGSGAISNPSQGWSVALSADGNTAIEGGPFDNDIEGANPVGAVWVFTRSGGVWTQQGSKLGGTGEVGTAQQGWSVALSGDGNTLIEGGEADDGLGAAWVFTRSGGIWTQQGSKLVGTGAVGPGSSEQGYSVGLSADGNIAIVGGPGDNSSAGAAWVFTRTNGVWSQQGNKLVGNGAEVTSAKQGSSVALSGDGNTAVVGGPGDNGSAGAAWVFVKATPTNTHDFNGDGYSDILWRDTSGNLAIWEMQGSTILNANSAGLGGVATTWSIVGQHDFNGDGYADMLWHDTSGNLAIWEMNGTTILNANSVGLGALSTVWTVAGVGDFNGDGMADILWRNTTTGDVAIWFMNGTTILNSNAAGVGNVATNWSVVGVGDFSGDGMADILWQNNNNGNLAIYLMNGTTITSSTTFANPGSYSVVGIGDFNGDGMSDILLRDGSGDIAIWEMNGTTILNPSTAGVGNLSTVWSVSEAGDFNGDGYSDILWRDTSGDIAIWYMNGTMLSSGAGLGAIPTTFTIQGTNAD
jgi:hypothetical protein